ncbi:unnamed protein product [Rotaria sp. Silwood2]|nr:unnamed protein product [Rotaria sp. Silwood2]
MDNLCRHCNALHFRGECASDRQDEFKQCCHYGSIQLPELLPYSDEIKVLLQGTDIDSRNFRENIRSYNNARAFVSMGAQIDLPQGYGPYCFRIHGQIYHRIGPLHPEPDQRAQFGQLYHRIHDRRLYNLPTANEVAAVFVGEDNEVPTHRHIAIHPRGKDLQIISILHTHCDPMIYPLLFPRGDEGWHQDLEKTDQSRKRTRISMLQSYSYRLAVRQTFNAIHYAGKLFQQYIVDAYVKTEQNRLAFHRQNQKALRVELYQGLMDHFANEAVIEGLKPGRVIILPSSFQGGPRAMQQNYQDAMTIVRKYGKPDLFITFTCNPTWREIEEQLFPGQTPSDRPDLITRVFKLKLDDLIDDLFKKHILGRTIANVFVIEFQKRGLPHCHMLIILDSEDKIKDDNHIDRIVCSEIPDAARFPQLYECVRRYMIHGPCGTLNPHSPCMEEGKCSKEFPKEFQNETMANKDGYPRYRRRDNGITMTIGKYEVDNRWIGHDCANIKLERPIQQGAAAQKTLELDEIKAHLDARYFSAPEAAWRLFEFPLNDKSHAIIRLAVHLPNQQPVYFAAENEQQALEKAVSKDTTLIAWFK